ncbi:TlyA family RNA methyltransferase [Alicyclobacillus sp. TC]|nr:TlyA family RNA methyltransferase [Alicyclobacillus sp. TC]
MQNALVIWQGVERLTESKQRLDIWLYQNQLFPSREAARRAIMAGWIFVNGERAEKAGTLVREGMQVEVRGQHNRYVSRGGLKLEKALRVFDISCEKITALDIGASTGGFTDCLLQHGADRVYALDVGYGQLDWKLRQNPKVVVLERTNFRHVDKKLFDPLPQMVVMDVSFISTRLLFQKINEIVQKPGIIISLIKPQFEAGREFVGKGGIIRQPDVHRRVLLDMLESVNQMGWSCRGLDVSPITGGDGNIEFLAYWYTEPGFQIPLHVDDVVHRAWHELKPALSDNIRPES